MISELPAGGVKRLNESGGMANEECVAGGSRQHAGYSEPCVGHVTGRVLSVPYTQHVRQGFE